MQRPIGGENADRGRPGSGGGDGAGIVEEGRRRHWATDLDEDVGGEEDHREVVEDE